MPDWAALEVQIRDLHAQRKTDTEIAETVGVKRQSLVDQLRRWGLKPPRQTSKLAKRKRISTDESPAERQEPIPREEAIVSTIVDIVPVNDIAAPLSPDEAQTLEHYEQIIAQGLQTFVEVGHALLAIRDQRLYRRDYGTFEEYLNQRWDLSRPRAYQLMDAAQAVDAVSTIVDIVPANEAQARPLASLPPKQQREVWKEAVETAPPSGITAKHVQATVKRVREKISTPKPQEPEPRRPARQEVQEGLIWGLREVNDADAWEMLESLWDRLNTLAPKYQSLRGMLHRVKRRFPDGAG